MPLLRLSGPAGKTKEAPGYAMIHRNRDRQQLLFCGEACAVMFESMGLQSALTFLYAYLGRHYPICRIFAGFRHYKRAEFVPVADSMHGPTNAIMTLTTSNLTQEEIQELMGTDAFEPYLVRLPALKDASQLVAEREDFACYLRVPLFTQGESTLQLAFCSRREDAFDEEDKELFFQLTRPLAERMQQDFSASSTPVMTTNAAEKCSRLLMCRGLTPLIEEIKRIAPTDCTVLVQGPTGSGKEVVADTLHALSRRASGPFIKINCGAIAESLLESELFGYERGAFTGAQQTRAGYFEAANGGTIFLDEVGELPPRMQVSLLRVLDNREIVRVGSTRPIPLNVRIIAATHRNLRSMVREGTFREDLWYRLNGYALQVPPLHAHRSDIPTLVHHFVNRTSIDMHLACPPRIGPEDMEALCVYHWPGNIRELQHVVARAMLRARMGNTCEHLDFRGIIQALALEHEALAAPLPPSAPAGNRWPTLAEWRDNYIARALEKCGGKITGPRGAAALLSVHPNTLRNYRSRKKLASSPEGHTGK